MKRLFFNEFTIKIQLTFILFSFLFLISCSNSPEADSANASGNLKVLAPLVNSQDLKQGETSLRIIELLDINNLQEVSGRFVKFFFGPKIVGNRLEGEKPRGLFFKNDQGQFIPANDLSQQMVAIYFHLQNLAQLDNDLGAQGINKWPRSVAIGVNVKGGSYNNAFYDGKTDAMFFVPYTHEQIPIPVNGGILAHEHFHSLFYKLVLRSIKTDAKANYLPHDGEAFLNFSDLKRSDSGGRISEVESQDLRLSYHNLVLRGLNEGLADFWGWMYSGNPDFIAASLPSEKRARSLNANDSDENIGLPNIRGIKSMVNILLSYDSKYVDQYLMRNSYKFGTQVSRFMKRFSEISARERNIDSLEARKLVALWIIKVLPEIRNTFINLKLDEYYNPSQLLVSFARAIPDLRENECLFLTDVAKKSFPNELKLACQKNNLNWDFLSESIVVENNSLGPNYEKN